MPRRHGEAGLDLFGTKATCARQLNAVTGGLLVLLLLCAIPGCRHDPTASSRLPRGSLTKPCEQRHADGTRARLVRVPPRYPADARQSHASGYVLMRFDLDLEGAPREIVVVESSPVGLFDAAALAALEQWRYCPSNEPRKDFKVKLNFDPSMPR